MNEVKVAACNPACLYCGQAGEGVRKFGKTRKGEQRYQCKGCSGTWSREAPASQLLVEEKAMNNRVELSQVERSILQNNFKCESGIEIHRGGKLYARILIKADEGCT